MSYLSKVKSFADVEVTDKGVSTVQFLEASEGLVGLFDLFGSAAFSVVQSDLRGNITVSAIHNTRLQILSAMKKVRARYNEKPSTSHTLEELVENEKLEKKNTATEGLMWLLRGLYFTWKGLQNSYDDQSAELVTSFTKSYEGSLKQFHNFVVKGIFAVAMKACPYRKDFYAKLSAGGSEAETREKLGRWLSALSSIIERMDAFYKKHNYGKVY